MKTQFQSPQQSGAGYEIRNTPIHLSRYVADHHGRLDARNASRQLLWYRHRVHRARRLIDDYLSYRCLPPALRKIVDDTLIEFEPELFAPTQIPRSALRNTEYAI